MGKQKIVMKVQMEDAKKRAKALKVAVGLEGVISATLDGEKIVVVGDVDSVKLTVLLRKKMGFAELLSVAAAEEKKDEKKDEKPAEGEKKNVQTATLPYQYQYALAPPQYIYETRDPYNNDACCIM